MLEAYRRMTDDLLRAHEQNVITFLRSDERFLDCEEDAAEMGLTLSVGIHETYTAETKSRHTEVEGKFPYGYSSELEIDFVRDGNVMMTNPDEGPAVQLSVTATIVRTPETMFIKRIELIPYDELIEDGELFDGIEDFLDDIEEHGFGAPSPFLCDEMQSPDVSAPLSLCRSPAELPDASCVEFQAGSFCGVFGREDSVYLSRDAELPYRALYAHILGRRYLPGGVLTLNNEESLALVELLHSLADAAPGALCYGDILNALSIYEFTPPGNAERLLKQVIIRRTAAFIETTRALADALSEMISREGCVTVIDS